MTKAINIPEALKNVLIEMKEDGIYKTVYVDMAVKAYSDLDWEDYETAWAVLDWFDNLK